MFIWIFTVLCCCHWRCRSNRNETSSQPVLQAPRQVWFSDQHSSRFDTFWHIYLGFDIVEMRFTCCLHVSCRDYRTAFSLFVTCQEFVLAVRSRCKDVSFRRKWNVCHSSGHVLIGFGKACLRVLVSLHVVWYGIPVRNWGVCLWPPQIDHSAYLCSISFCTFCFVFSSQQRCNLKEWQRMLCCLFLYM